MLQSLMISKVESDPKTGASYLECKMEKADYGIVKAHPQFITIFGVRFRQTGWNSERQVVHYMRIR